ncbi:MAG: sugar ABC transporter permease [Candidatus Marinimicrobia bacterium]|jgi:multiple sugar transport system permease protein|nr:sugar ABC transporter permease [Candidatus Neomarinimicrobiota bacterium]MBT4852838.1 sugar ABC transporter permease [Candidatus Neomarinimicrobiota bacterium]MBT6217655.1 sugar ABC transporter permease [Candidatus Neomarinimicrobiota bacterium]
MSSPYVIFFLIFSVYPILFSVTLVFHRWNIISPMRFVGFENIRYLLNDPLYWKSIGNTFYFLLIHIPLQVGLALVLANALNKKLRGITFFRASFFLPVVISGVVVTILWKSLYSTETGLLNSLLIQLGLAKIPWLTSVHWAMPSIAIMATWKNVGLYTVFFLAGLQSIPTHLYEAAELDGASSFQKFIHITVPMLNPIVLMVVILSTINGFNLFIEPYVTTGGGPVNSTLSVVLYIYRQAFSFYKMGYAATIGFSLAMIIFAVTILQKRLLEKDM